MQRHIETQMAKAEWRHCDSECLEITYYARLKNIPGQIPEMFSVVRPIERLNGPRSLRNWLGRKSPKCPEFGPTQLPGCECLGMLRLLIQRNKRLKRDLEKPSGYDFGQSASLEPSAFNHTTMGQSHELGPMTPRPPIILPWESPETYELVREALNLPRTYIPALNHSSGIVELSTVTGTEGKRSIGFIAQNTNYRWESWSLALSYDPATNITTGFFCADAESSDPNDTTIDVDAIIDDLVHQESPSIHPLHLPTIMLSQLHASSVNHYTSLHHEIWSLEQHIGTAKVKASDEDEDFHHHNWSRALNACKKQQASRDGRYPFRNQFHRVLLRAMDAVKIPTAKNDIKVMIPERRYESHMTKAHQELEQWISFTVLESETYEGRDINSNGRIDALLKRLYNLITQKEYRAQVHIAKDMYKDSTAMKFCAVLGALFCPATFIATMFSIQEYDKFTSSNFLIYLQRAAPFIVVFALLLPARWLWEWRRDRILSLKTAAEKEARSIRFQES